MKPTKLLLLLLTICFISSATNTEGNDQKQQPSKDVIQTVLKQRRFRQSDKRTNAPSRQVIMCSYDGTSITMSFVLPEGMCEISVTELSTNATMTYYADSSDLIVELPVGSIGDSSIELVTENGNTYSGVLSEENYIENN